MIHPGQLRDSVTLQRQAEDANGDRLGATWEDAVVRDCRVTYLRAGETVLEARLRGVTTVVITVRLGSDPDVLQVDNTWRAVVTNAQTGAVVTYDIKSALPHESGDYVDFTAQDAGRSGGV